jgi:predicted RNA-binding Zn-ribbon protein involved in translation (DUF1610 family)
VIDVFRCYQCGFLTAHPHLFLIIETANRVVEFGCPQCRSQKIARPPRWPDQPKPPWPEPAFKLFQTEVGIVVEYVDGDDELGDPRVREVAIHPKNALLDVPALVHGGTLRALLEHIEARTAVRLESFQRSVDVLEHTRLQPAQREAALDELRHAYRMPPYDVVKKIELPTPV